MSGKIFRKVIVEGERKMKCVHCGTEITNPNIKFCSNCGNEISKIADNKAEQSIDIGSGKARILFKFILGEYCKTGLKSKESHDKIKQKASILGVSSSLLERYMIAFLEKVEKVNAYIAEIYNGDDELSEDEQAFEVCLYASDYGFEKEEAEELIEYNRILRVTKVVTACRAADLKKREMLKVKFPVCEMNVKEYTIYIPGICEKVKELYEAALVLINNYKLFEQEIRKIADVRYDNVERVVHDYLERPLVVFYEILDSNDMVLDKEWGSVQAFRKGLYEFDELLEDEQYVKNNRREVLLDILDAYKNMINEVITVAWDTEYVGYLKCVEKQQEEKSFIEDLKVSKKSDEEIIKEIISYINQGVFFADVYVYLANFLQLKEETEIEFLESIQKYVVDLKNNENSIKAYLNRKYNLTERRSVADVILGGNRNNQYFDGSMIEYGSDAEAMEARKQREDIIDIHAKLDYSSNKAFYPSLKMMECIYKNTGIGAALIDDAKRVCEQRKQVSDLIFIKKKGLLNDNKKISYKTLEEASEAEQYKNRIIEFYNECTFTSDSEMIETLSKIGDVYQKSGIGEKVLEYCKLRYQQARSVTDVIVGESGEVIADGEPLVCDTIQQRNSIKEELDRAIHLFVESRKNNYDDVEQVYEQVKIIVDKIKLGHNILNVLHQEVKKMQEKLAIYDYVTDYNQGSKKRSILSRKRVERLCESQAIAETTQKLIDSIVEVYQNCNLTNWDSVKNAIEKVQSIYTETQCGKAILDELIYRYQELDKTRLRNQEKLIYDDTLASTSSYMIYEKSILEELIENLEEKNFQSKDIIERINGLKSKLLVLKEHETTEYYEKGKVLRTLFETIGDSVGICLYGKPGFVETSMKIAKEKTILSEDLKTYFPMLIAGTWYRQETFFEGIIITDEYVAVLGYLMVTDQKMYLNTLEKIKVNKNKIELHSDEKIVKFKMSEEIAIIPMLEALAQHLKIMFEVSGVRKNYAETVNTQLQKSEELSEINSQNTIDRVANKETQQVKWDAKCSDSVQQKTMQMWPNMKKRRFFLYLLLSFITCGVYSLYFWYQYTEDVNRICDGDGKKSPNYIVVVLLSCITLGIYSIYWRYAQTNRLYKAGLKYQVPIREKGVSVILLYLAAMYTYFISIFVAQFIMINIINRFANAEL